MQARGRGRPRASGPPTSGLGTAEDILRAAAHLFCAHGFGSQSTYAICRKAGVTQGSMYHYFANKHEVLLALLLRTVKPSVQFAERLNKRPEDAEVRLWALCSYDASLLADGDLNIGLLFLLPEASDPEVDEFRVERDRLIKVYRELSRECAGVDHDDVHELTTMVVALIESVVLIRRLDPDADRGAIANRIADTALRVIGVSSSQLNAIRTQGARVREVLERESAGVAP